jgi:N-acetylneuraminic acid mutarotase
MRKREFDDNPRKPGERSKLFDIAWERGPSLPQGFQDSAGAIMGDTLLTVCGFCTGYTIPQKPKEKYPRGFLKKAWGLDLSDPVADWFSLPDFPGAPRQMLSGIAVEDRFYCWGGFSYTEPCCYKDGYRLSYTLEKWRWERLPDLPWMMCCAGICGVDSKIYLCGGADYDNAEHGGMYTDTDRNGAVDRFGARLFMFDTTDEASGFRELPQCPGTPRSAPTIAAVGTDIYLIGGITGGDHNRELGYMNCVDNWKFDTLRQTWQRLSDLPVSSSGFPGGAIVYEDRYLFLVGGYQYEWVAHPDGTYGKKYGKASRFYERSIFDFREDRTELLYFNDVFVYDVKTDSFGTASTLPLNNFMPLAVLREDDLYLIGGETGGSEIDGESFSHHPDLFLKGRIRPVGEEARKYGIPCDGR